MKYKLSNKVLRANLAAQLADAENKLASMLGVKVQYEGSSAAIRAKMQSAYADTVEQINHYDTLCCVLQSEIERLDAIIKKEPDDPNNPQGKSGYFLSAELANVKQERDALKAENNKLKGVTEVPADSEITKAIENK